MAKLVTGPYGTLNIDLEYDSGFSAEGLAKYIDGDSALPGIRVRTHIQNITVAARAQAERKRSAHLS